MRLPVFVALAVLMTVSARAAQIATRTVAVEFDESRKGAISDFSSVDGIPFSGGNPLPLVSLDLTRTGVFTNTLTVTSAEARRFEVKNFDGGMDLVYGEVGEAVSQIVCRVSFGSATDDVRWRLQVTVRDGWTLRCVDYPCIKLSAAIGGEGADDALVCGSVKGGVYRQPAKLLAESKTGYFAFGQPGGLALQFAALYDRRAGFYWACEDGRCQTKYLIVRRQADGIGFYWRRVVAATGTYRQDYDVVTRTFQATDEDTTWHDAADIYRTWAQKQSWCARKFREREDVPRWLKEPSAMVRFWKLDETDAICSWAKAWKTNYPGVPLLMAIWGWEKDGMWIAPDYFPVKMGTERFARFVAALRDEDVHVFPWPSGYAWTLTAWRQHDGRFLHDSRRRFEEIGLPHAVMGWNGIPFREKKFWLGGGEGTELCGRDPWVRHWFADEVCRPLAELGCDVIQLDQVVGGELRGCYATNHGHRPGAVDDSAACVRDQLKLMRSAMAKSVSTPVVGVEEPNECFLDLVGVQDYRDCEAPQDEWASVYNYVYHEYAMCFQSNPRFERCWNAHCAVDGQLPHFRPDRPKELTLSNGYDRFMARWMAIRSGEKGELLRCGRQVKPPMLFCKLLPYEVKLGDREIRGEKPAVFSQAYQSPRGHVVVFFANATGETQRVPYLWKGRMREVVVEADDVVSVDLENTK